MYLKFVDKQLLKCFFVVTLIMLFGCRKDSVKSDSDSMIILEWVKSYSNETIENGTKGLKWALSHIGATYLESSIIQNDSVHLQIDIDQMGFDPKAIIQLEILHNKIKLSEAYKKNYSVDLGRYICLIVGASEHYYKIVNQPEELSDLIAQYQLSDRAGFVNESSVSPKDRIIRFSNQESFSQLFMAEERDKMTGELLEFETIELMLNGQLRFGVYDKYGQRIPAADPSKSNAGKPAKCMWCHESTIQPLFSNQNDYPDFLSYIQLKDTLNHFKKQHEMLQGMLNGGGVDFSDKVVHEEMELQYIAFMEPSLERLMNEWRMSKVEVQKKVENFSTHQHPEFPFLGDLYNRADVESLAPHKNLGVSSDVREESEVEVNYLN